MPFHHNNKFVNYRVSIVYLVVERMGFEPTLNGFLVSNAGADPA